MSQWLWIRWGRVEMKFNDHSRYGLVGLRNLEIHASWTQGFNAYHMVELTEYFWLTNILVKSIK